MTNTEKIALGLVGVALVGGVGYYFIKRKEKIEAVLLERRKKLHDAFEKTIKLYPFKEEMFYSSSHRDVKLFFDYQSPFSIEKGIYFNGTDRNLLKLGKDYNIKFGDNREKLLSFSLKEQDNSIMLFVTLSTDTKSYKPATYQIK